jgi:signal transduction histidine kinase
MHRDLNQVLLPVIDDILAAARDLVVSYQKSIDREMETYHRETARQDSFNLALLYLFIISGSLALLLNIRGNFRNYRAAREELAEAERVVTQLKDLDSAKNSLISTVNHELRTPLTSIIGYIEILRRDVAEKPKEEISNYLEVIERNSLILLRLVESLLSLSKFDGNKGRLPDEDVNLLEVLDTAIFAINPSAQSKDIAVKREGLLPVYVKGDIGQLNQVFINLLTNAIKFSPSQSEVVISMRIIEASKVEVTIKDQGIGISEEDLPRIFTRFFRAEGVKNQGFEGFGLGLAIVQQAVSHHEGQIEVTSKLGEGSTFIVTFPVSKEENLIEA